MPRSTVIDSANAICAAERAKKLASAEPICALCDRGIIKTPRRWSYCHCATGVTARAEEDHRETDFESRNRALPPDEQRD